MVALLDHPAAMQAEFVKTMVLVSAMNFTPPLWIVPNGGHGTAIGEKWTEFLTTATTFLAG